MESGWTGRRDPGLGHEGHGCPANILRTRLSHYPSEFSQGFPVFLFGFPTTSAPKNNFQLPARRRAFALLLAVLLWFG